MSQVTELLGLLCRNRSERVRKVPPVWPIKTESPKRARPRSSALQPGRSGLGLRKSRPAGGSAGNGPSDPLAKRQCWLLRFKGIQQKLTRRTKGENRAIILGPNVSDVLTGRVGTPAGNVSSGGKPAHFKNLETTCFSQPQFPSSTKRFGAVRLSKKSTFKSLIYTDIPFEIHTLNCLLDSST